MTTTFIAGFALLLGYFMGYSRAHKLISKPVNIEVKASDVKISVDRELIERIAETEGCVLVRKELMGQAAGKA